MSPEEPTKPIEPVPLREGKPVQRNFVDEWTAKLKSKPYIAAIIIFCSIIGGLASLLKSCTDIHQSLQQMHPASETLHPSNLPQTQNSPPNPQTAVADIGAKPTLVAFTLSPNSVGYMQAQAFLYGEGPETYKTFEPKPPPNKDPQAIFLVTIKNPLDQDLIINEIDYEVISTGEVKGIESGPLQSLATYRQTIAHVPGIQKRDLIPPFQVATRSAASFELHLLSESQGYGLGWYLRVIFKTDQGDVATDPFQLFLPSLSPGDMLPPRSVASLPKPQQTQDLLSTPKSVSFDIPIERENCIFALAHLDKELRGMDQMSLDLLYGDAANYTAQRFAEKYPKIPATKRIRLQTVVKASIGCAGQ